MVDLFHGYRRKMLVVVCSMCIGSISAQTSSMMSESDIEMSDHSPVRVKRIAEGHYFMDFGKAYFGTVVMQTDLEAVGPFTLHVGEKQTDGPSVDRDPGGTIRYQEVKIEGLPAGVWTRAGLEADYRNTHPPAVALPDSFGTIMPFRFCEIEGLQVPIEHVEFRQRAYHYRFNDEAGNFVSSDTLLNRIWDLCKHTIKATSFTGYYIDGDRERIPYEADAFINQLSHYCVDSVYDIARRTNLYFLEHPTWPTEWILHVVPLFYYDYLYTGDAGVLLEHYEDLKVRTLMALEREDGLISSASVAMNGELMKNLGFSDTTKRLRDIVDWPPSQKDTGWELATEEGERDGYEMVDVSTVVNAFYYRNLVLMARIAGALGKERDAAFFEAKSGLVMASINSVLLDRERGVYMDGEGSDHASLHANMFPLAFDLVPGDYRETVIRHIKSRGMACSVYGAQYLLEGLCRAGETGYALKLITDTAGDRNWWNMIESGSTMTMEAWDIRYKPNLDWNHAWGTAPANIITRFIWGIRPGKAGFTEALVAPHPGTLTHSKIRVPTRLGAIDAMFEKEGNAGNYTIMLPEGMPATFSIPGKPRDVRLNGRPAYAPHGIVSLHPGENLVELIYDTDEIYAPEEQNEPNVHHVQNDPDEQHDPGCNDPGETAD